MMMTMMMMKIINKLKFKSLVNAARFSHILSKGYSKGRLSFILLFRLSKGTLDWLLFNMLKIIFRHFPVNCIDSTVYFGKIKSLPHLLLDFCRKIYNNNNTNKQ